MPCHQRKRFHSMVTVVQAERRRSSNPSNDGERRRSRSVPISAEAALANIAARTTRHADRIDRAASESPSRGVGSPSRGTSGVVRGTHDVDIPHGSFVWMNGEPVNFTYWASNDRGPEPNNGFGRYAENYVNMDSRFHPAGGWNDVPNSGADWMNDRCIVESNDPGSSEVSTPEVSTLVLLGSGLAGLVLRRRRRARAAKNGDAAVEASQESNSTPVA